MKAILLVDEMPNNCVDCPLADRERIVECCFITGNPIINTFYESEEELVRNEDCPLITEEQYVDRVFPTLYDMVVRGILFQKKLANRVSVMNIGEEQ